ncbi:MAG TPA: dihydrofolate reductase family protein [Flavisolibacter sp.]|nr:dihydrofolate reductase family protein [Flavisolibacter sp.]
MRKLVVIVHVSLDGFVAGANGGLPHFSAGEECLEFVCRITKEADALLLGRVSYELLNNYWYDRKDHPDASWNEIVYSHWYGKTEKYVASTTMQPTPCATILCEALEDNIRELKAKPGKNIFVFGSPSLVQTLFRSGLADACWVFVNPVIFGKGISLFSGEENVTQLRLVESACFENGAVALHYSFGGRLA